MSVVYSVQGKILILNKTILQAGIFKLLNNSYLLKYSSMFQKYLLKPSQTALVETGRYLHVCVIFLCYV